VRKSARRTKVRGLCRRAERAVREDRRAEVGEEVRVVVGVRVRVSPVEFKLYRTFTLDGLSDADSRKSVPFWLRTPLMGSNCFQTPILGGIHTRFPAKWPKY